MMGELPPVQKAAAIFRQYCYDYRDQLLAGIIVAGWDPKLGGQVRFLFCFNQYDFVDLLE